MFFYYKPTVYQVLIHVLHCLKLFHFSFETPDLGIQTMAFLHSFWVFFSGVSGYFPGCNAFIVSPFVFPECTVVLFGLNKWLYHFSFMDISPRAPCSDPHLGVLGLPHRPCHGASHPCIPSTQPLCPSSYFPLYQHTFLCVSRKGG